MFEDVWFAWGAETVEVGAETIEIGAETIEIGAETIKIGAETVKFGAEIDNIFSWSRKCGLHGVPKTTKSKCRKKVPKKSAETGGHQTK